MTKQEQHCLGSLSAISGIVYLVGYAYGGLEWFAIAVIGWSLAMGVLNLGAAAIGHAAKATADDA